MSTVITFPSPNGHGSLDERVSAEVRALMGRYNVIQIELAAWLGIRQSSLSARLSNTTDWKVRDIERVAEGFGVHPAALMGGYAANGPGPDGPGSVPIKAAAASYGESPATHR